MSFLSGQVGISASPLPIAPYAETLRSRLQEYASGWNPHWLLPLAKNENSPMQSDHEFLLVCEALMDPAGSGGTWRFAIEHLDGRLFLEASDTELGDANRIAMWAVVRGLEALPGPSGVTMLTGNRYVIRSLSENLNRWRSTDFQWEHFGTRLPVSNADLWRRVDRALGIHQVSACCVAAAPNLGRDLGWERPAPTQRTESMPSVTDGLRRWLLAQCGFAPSQTAVA
jgi:ribonuclease HI